MSLRRLTMTTMWLGHASGAAQGREYKKLRRLKPGLQPFCNIVTVHGHYGKVPVRSNSTRRSVDFNPHTPGGALLTPSAPCRISEDKDG